MEESGVRVMCEAFPHLIREILTNARYLSGSVYVTKLSPPCIYAMQGVTTAHILADRMPLNCLAQSLTHLYVLEHIFYRNECLWHAPLELLSVSLCRQAPPIDVPRLELFGSVVDVSTLQKVNHLTIDAHVVEGEFPAISLESLDVTASVYDVDWSRVRTKKLCINSSGGDLFDLPLADMGVTELHLNLMRMTPQLEATIREARISKTVTVNQSAYVDASPS
jgi:hypothetical protein